MSMRTAIDPGGVFGLPEHPYVPVNEPVIRATLARIAVQMRAAVKRGFDVSSAAFLLMLLLPILASIAMLVRASSPGPVLYGHERIGLNGRRFRCWKFRSMVPDSDAALARHLAGSQAARTEWAATRKLREDPRVTPLGAVLRSLSIDELPQLVNVLLGEMSLVGPRPVTDGELALYGSSARHYLRRRPGITGLWQVSGRNEMTYERRVALDRAYVTRCGSVADLMILVRTIPAVLRSHGAW